MHQINILEMKSISIAILLNLFTLFSILAQQQEARCGFPKTTEEKKQQHGYFFDYQEQLNREIEKRKQEESLARTEETSFLIPIIVHVIHNGEPIGTGTNISAAQIQTQIDVLNEDYGNYHAYTNRTLPQFKDLADDARIRFILADFDPNGNRLAEKGIRRLPAPNGRRVWTFADFDRDVKPNTIWDTNRYLNIWTVDSLREGSTVFTGYSSLPDLTNLGGIPNNGSGNLNNTDGIVIRYNRFGSLAKIDVPQLRRTNARGFLFVYGRTLTHEVGHFLGLLHPWEAENCSFDGDYCPDTPLTSQEVIENHLNTECSLNQIRCGQVTMVQNYMDYGRDTCMTLFTKDQIRRMRTVLQVSPRRVALTKSNVVSYIDRILSDNISIYPNPTHHYIRVSAPDIRLKSYQIYHLQGQLVMQDYFDEITQSIDVSKLSAGIYLLQIQTNRGIAVKKILIE